MSPAFAAFPESKADEGHSARLTAGFCWPRSDPRPDGDSITYARMAGESETLG